MNMPIRTADGAPAAALSPFASEVERRRTFAIISHPDAGKTTLTEKLLLFGGAIQGIFNLRSVGILTVSQKPARPLHVVADGGKWLV